MEPSFGQVGRPGDGCGGDGRVAALEAATVAAVAVVCDGVYAWAGVDDWGPRIHCSRHRVPYTSLTTRTPPLVPCSWSRTFLPPGAGRRRRWTARCRAPTAAASPTPSGRLPGGATIAGTPPNCSSCASAAPTSAGLGRLLLLDRVLVLTAPRELEGWPAVHD